MGGIANAASVAVLVILGLAFGQNLIAGRGREWLAAKFLNRGAPPPPDPASFATTPDHLGGPVNVQRPVSGTARLADPLPGGQTVSVWGDARDGGRRRHEGIDIAAPRGRAVLAVGEGVAVRVGNAGNLCGLRVALDLGGGLEALYCHLSGFAVKQGASVRRGQVVGFVGNTGNARTTGPHLHFELRRSGQPFNPAPSIGR